MRKRTNTLLNDGTFNRNKVNNIKRFYKEGEFTLKDTTAILFHYSHSAFIYKALNSLKNIESRVKSIIVLQERRMSPIKWSKKLEIVISDGNDNGNLLNDMIGNVTTPYVIFLHEEDYLSPTVHPDTLILPNTKSVLGTYYYNRNIVIEFPVFIRTSLLKQEKLLPLTQLPFRESFLPAWFASIEPGQIIMKENLIRQSSMNRSATTIEKESIMQKYQKPVHKSKQLTISVVIATYNMEKYIETAVVSCLLQTEMFDQILIMDDGSTDGSDQKLEQLANEKQVKIFHKKNEGKAKALNELLPHVTSDFILELDADDWLDADACSVIKKHLSNLPEEVAVLYGNLRKWKQKTKDILFKTTSKGVVIKEIAALLSYQFPLGPRIYKTSILKEEGGFPVLDFEDGRLYEDVSVLHQLLKKYSFCYKDFTVYNVREHQKSITKNNESKWQTFLQMLKSQK